MIPKRMPRIFLVGAMAIGLLATPLTTLAATPNWSGAVVALPRTISPNDIAGYGSYITNGGPSNISQLFVTATYSDATSNAHPNYVKLTLDGADITLTACGSDPLSGPVSCTVGALNSGSTATLVVAYQTSGTADVSGTIAWTSVGLGSGSGDNSRGDVLTGTAITSFNTDGTNFDGGFPTAAQLFQTSQSLGSGNLFGTKFNAAAYEPVSLEDDTTFSTPGAPAGTTFYAGGKGVMLSIDNGVPFGDGVFKKVTVTIYKDAVPKGSNVKNVTVLHYSSVAVNGVYPLLESIGNDCPTSGSITSPCRTVSWDGKSGTWTLEIWINHTSGMKFA
jgi:hypothetical protein